jgi:hypothetical protein
MRLLSGLKRAPSGWVESDSSWTLAQAEEILTRIAAVWPRSALP